MIQTIRNTDDFIQSLSIAELKAWSVDSTPITLNYTQEEIEKSEQIYKVMDETDLDYEDVEKILFEPKKASLGVIQTYCKTLNIDIVDFIGKALV
jgi:Ca2+-binding EF-hand superfamily protein